QLRDELAQERDVVRSGSGRPCTLCAQGIPAAPRHTHVRQGVWERYGKAMSFSGCVEPRQAPEHGAALPCAVERDEQTAGPRSKRLRDIENVRARDGSPVRLSDAYRKGGFTMMRATDDAG